MKPSHILTAAALFLIQFPTAAAPATKEPVPAGSLALRTERVIVFKDGYCLVIKTATGTTDRDGILRTGEVPENVVLGSFWAVADDGSLKSMKAGWRERRETLEKVLPCTQMIEILDANLGKACTLELTDDTKLEGTIRQVLTTPTETLANPMALSAFGLPTTDQARVAGISGSSFVLHTDRGDVLTHVSQVKRLRIDDMATTRKSTATRDLRTKELQFRFGPKAAGQDKVIRLMYFRPGLRWIPTYRIDVGTATEEDKRARIALQAELINELEDLREVPVDIVVGVPNFRFREALSPFTLEHTMRNALAQAAPTLMNGQSQFSNSLYTQRSSEFRNRSTQASGVAGDRSVDLPGELTAAGHQDLFVYRLAPISLAVGERTALPIFTANVPFRDVYTWDIHVKRSDIELAPSGSGQVSPLTLAKNRVWHQIELTNTTDLPWTTGAAMILQGHQPLAQDLLTYTSPTDAVRVPITVSVETRGHFDEQESDRTLNALVWERRQYAKIVKRARLHLCNNKPHPIDLEITLRLGGAVTETTEGGAVKRLPYDPQDWTQYRGDAAVNNSSIVTWKATVGAGKTIEPEVVYHYLTRH